MTKISKSPVYIWTWRFENARSMDWYYSIVLAYRIDLENLDIRLSDECEKAEFFSKDELANMSLCKQTNYLKQVFNPDDFNNKFQHH